MGAKIEVDNSGDGRKIKLSGQLDSEVTYYDVPGDFSSAALIISALITKDSICLLKMLASKNDLDCRCIA